MSAPGGRSEASDAGAARGPQPLRRMREALAGRPERLLAFLLAAYATVSAWDFAGRHACIDYYQFWVVGRAVAAGETRDPYPDAERARLGQLYLRNAQEAASAAATGAGPPAEKRLRAARMRPTLETYSSPWLYTLAGFTSSGDYDRDVTVFQRQTLLHYLVAIALLAWLLGYSPAAGALWTAALLQPFNPFVDDVVAGNVNRAQLFDLALVLALLRWRRLPGRLLAGCVLGSLVAFKPNLASVALVLGTGWAVEAKWRKLAATAAGAAAGAALSIGASAAFFGSLAPWRSWLAELPDLSAPGSPVAGSADEGNYSLARLLHDRAGVDAGPWLAALLLGLATAALWRARARDPGVSDRRGTASSDRGDPGGSCPRGTGSSDRRDVLLVGLGAALPLLASELAWQHYFVLAVPLSMFLLRPIEGPRPGCAPLRLLALAALAMVALQNVGRLFGLHHPQAGAGVVAGGTLLLFALAIADLLLAPRRAS